MPLQNLEGGHCWVLLPYFIVPIIIWPSCQKVRRPPIKNINKTNSSGGFMPWKHCSQWERKDINILNKYCSLVVHKLAGHDPQFVKRFLVPFRGVGEGGKQQDSPEDWPMWGMGSYLQLPWGFCQNLESPPGCWQSSQQLETSESSSYNKNGSQMSDLIVSGTLIFSSCWKLCKQPVGLQQDTWGWGLAPHSPPATRS